MGDKNAKCITPKHRFYAMVYQRFSTMSFAAKKKKKRLNMQFANPHSCWDPAFL
jgi:hypothetical protein